MSDEGKAKNPYQHIKDELLAVKKKAGSVAYWITPQWHDTRFHCDDQITKGLNQLTKKLIDLRRMHCKLRKVRVTEVRPTDFHGPDGVERKNIEYYVGPNTMQELDEMELPGEDG